ncbi:ImmA/IrrE family metallo-endopeptidase [Enterococcus faecalis]|nr:ImmA/IrrE family metallo-endopeptidase [Enterococcus faecalis]
MLLLRKQIEMIVKELGVIILEKEDLDADGHYIASINTIVLKGSLDEWNKRKILLHELGHASKHQHNYQLYNLAFSLHSKMEHEADVFMIDNLLDDYMSKTGLTVEQVNYMRFIEDADIDARYEECIRTLLFNKLQRINFA